MIYLVYQHRNFDIPSISFDIPGITEIYILIYYVYQEYISRKCDNRLPYTFEMLKNEEMGARAQPERDSGGNLDCTTSFKIHFLTFVSSQMLVFGFFVNISITVIFFRLNHIYSESVLNSSYLYDKTKIRKQVLPG